MNTSTAKAIRPLLIIFIAFNALGTAKHLLGRLGIDQELFIWGNLIIAVVSFLSFFLTRRTFKSANPHAFVRAIYGSFIIKFFVIAIAAFIYIFTAKEHVNKAGIIACLVLYIFYTFIEVATLTKLLKEKKNA